MTLTKWNEAPAMSPKDTAAIVPIELIVGPVPLAIIIGRAGTGTL